MCRVAHTAEMRWRSPVYRSVSSLSVASDFPQARLWTEIARGRLHTQVVPGWIAQVTFTGQSEGIVDFLVPTRRSLAGVLVLLVESQLSNTPLPE